MNLRLLKYFSWIWLVLLVAACSTDRLYNDEASTPGLHQVRCFIQVPEAKDVVKTRAGNDNELDFSKLSILVYDQNDKFIAQAKVISQDPQYVQAENAYEVIISLPVTDELATLVFVANMDDVPALVSEGTSLDELYESLKFSFAGKWGNGKSSLVPMWGEINELKLVENMNATYSNEKMRVSLLRAMAQLDVKSDLASTVFKITSGHIYLSLSDGLVIPMAKNYDAINNKVSAPSVLSNVLYNVGQGSPTSNAGLALKSPLTYNLSGSSAELMFIPEQVNTGDGGQDLFIIIGGSYHGEATPTYYKITFDEDVKNKPFDILRNHRYILHIKSVNGPGYSTLDNAALSPSSNIDVDIVEWDENVNDGYVFGDKFFGIDGDPIYFDSPTAGQMKWVPYQTNLKDEYIAANLNFGLGDEKVGDFQLALNVKDKRIEIVTSKNDTRQPIKDNLLISILDRVFDVPLEQHPGNFDYFIDCDATKVYGAYVPNVPLTEDNYVEVRVYADTPISNTYYKLYTNTIDGISFSGEGSLNLTKDETGTYSQILKLQGTGMPKTHFPKYLDVFMNTTELQSCDIYVQMAYSPKKILGISNVGYGYCTQDNLSKIFRESEYNFGLLPQSIVKSNLLTDFKRFPETNPGEKGKHVAALRKALEDVDILIVGNLGEGHMDKEGVNEWRLWNEAIGDFLKQKGVVIMMDQAQGDILYLFTSLYGDSFKLSYKAFGSKGDRFSFTSIPGDPILNGPFGDVNGKEWGQDSFRPVSIGGIPSEDIEVYSYAFIDGTNSPMGIAIFRHLKYNLFFIGSAGFIASRETNTTEENSEPFLIDRNDFDRPIAKPIYGPSKGPYGPVYNSIFFGNVMNWALERAEFYGKNSTPY